MMHSDLVGLPALIVLIAGLVAFLASLIVARRRTRPVARAAAAGGARSRRSMIGIAVQMVGFAVVAAGPVRPLLSATSPLAIAETLTVAVLIATTLGLFVSASRALGRNWSFVARTLGDHQLVETGPFAVIRHPIYTALALFMVAMAIAYGHVSHLWLGAPFYIVGTWLRIAEEERLLRAMFGSAYDDYSRRVARFVPTLF